MSGTRTTLACQQSVATSRVEAKVQSAWIELDHLQHETPAALAANKRGLLECREKLDQLLAMTSERNGEKA